MNLILRVICFIYCINLTSAALIGDRRDFDVPDTISGQIETFSATARYTVNVRPGLDLTVWVEDSVYNSSTLNGLNQTGKGDLLQDRTNGVIEFATWLKTVLIPGFENSFKTFSEVNNSGSPGLNFLFLDLKDGFSTKGSYFASHFSPLDQEPSTGFNGMNLIYLDVNPGTIELEIESGITKLSFYREVVRVISRLLQYQSDKTEETWIKEGISQFMTYRLLKEKSFPNSQSLILDAPSKGISELSEYFEDISLMKAEYNFNEANLDRVYFRRNQLSPNDNIDSKRFRSFSYLFFTYLFQRAGGSFLVSKTDGDRFFLDLMSQPLDGVSGLEASLAARGLPDFKTLYSDYMLALVLRNQENNFHLDSFNTPIIDFTNKKTLTTVGQFDLIQLEKYQSNFLNLTNLNTIYTATTQYTPQPSLQKSKIYLLKTDAKGNHYIYREMYANDLSEFVGEQEKMVSMTLNLDSSTKQFHSQLVIGNAYQKVQLLMVGQEASSETSEAVQTFIVNDSNLPAQNQTGVIQVSLNQAGVWEGLTFENRTNSPILWSLEKSVITTRVHLYTKNTSNLSLSTLAPKTGIKVSLLRENSKADFVLINENTNLVNFSLFYEPLDSTLFPKKELVVPTPSTELTEAERRKIAGGGSGGCFVATASFGSKSHPIVILLSKFRDQYLLKNGVGVLFVENYYKYSPPIANWISKSKLLRWGCQLLLLPLVLFASLLMSSLLQILVLSLFVSIIFLRLKK
ncbi:MAG: hypothetical protein KC646_13990 [Candidatus Cloacimonetes bacterium]|nr:hypothetical protein [Candidatus Cloacimonadota bacterium]